MNKRMKNLINEDDNEVHTIEIVKQLQPRKKHIKEQNTKILLNNTKAQVVDTLLPHI